MYEVCLRTVRVLSFSQDKITYNHVTKNAPRGVRGGTQPPADLLTGPTTRDTHAGELEKCLRCSGSGGASPAPTSR